MVRFRLLWTICKRSHIDRFVVMFFVCYFISSAILWGVDPNIGSFRDGMWYMFVACTSIGFGDVTVSTITGRVITAFMTCYEILLVAMFSGVVVSHYLEVVNKQAGETATTFLDKLQHLSELSKEELKAIEEKVKEYTEKNHR